MAAVALAQVTKQPQARAPAIATSGSFEISNSHSGQPIFAASGIAPGEAATGTVAIEDTGSESVALTLRRGRKIDEPGLGGGLLSSRLHLTVLDIEARTYEFTATLPEGGELSFQNAVQEASTTVAYSWVASEAGGEEPPGGGEEEHGGGTTPEEHHAPANSGTSTDAGGGQSDGNGRVRRGLVARSATIGTRRVARVRWTSKAVHAPGPTASASASPARCGPGCRKPRASSASERACASPPSASTASGTWSARRSASAPGTCPRLAPSAPDKSVGPRPCAPCSYPKTIDQQLNLVVNRSIF